VIRVYSTLLNRLALICLALARPIDLAVPDPDALTIGPLSRYIAPTS
jgi:hypothetical protein